MGADAEEAAGAAGSVFRLGLTIRSPTGSLWVPSFEAGGGKGVAVMDGVKWDALPAARSADDLYAALRWDAFAPLAATLADMDRIRAATSTTDTLHLLPLIDSAGDARRLGNAAEALGPKLVGRAEVLGKAKLLRATTRITGTAWALVGGLAGLFLSAAMLFIHSFQHYRVMEFQKNKC